MAKRTILSYPDPRLHTVAKPVQGVDARIKTLVADMLETMYDANGIGLAATQVDVHERLVVIDVSEERNQPLVLINPEIVWASDEKVLNEEGCLSVPGIYDGVERSTAVRVHRARRRRRAADHRGRGPAGGLHPARTRPPAGQGVRRIPVAAQAQPHQEQAAQAAARGPEARPAGRTAVTRCRRAWLAGCWPRRWRWPAAPASPRGIAARHLRAPTRCSAWARPTASYPLPAAASGCSIRARRPASR